MKNRSVIEIMVLAFTFIVAISIVSLGAATVFVMVARPDTNADRLIATLSSLISSILGALLGLIAGRATTDPDLHQRPSGHQDDIPQRDDQ